MLEGFYLNSMLETISKLTSAWIHSLVTMIITSIFTLIISMIYQQMNFQQTHQNLSYPFCVCESSGILGVAYWLRHGHKLHRKKVFHQCVRASAFLHHTFAWRFSDRIHTGICSLRNSADHYPEKITERIVESFPSTIRAGSSKSGCINSNKIQTFFNSYFCYDTIVNN